MQNRYGVQSSGEVNGTYSKGKYLIPCTVFFTDGWYAVQGSVNVNRTHEDLDNGFDVELLSDYDTFTAGQPINDLEGLIEAVQE